MRLGRSDRSGFKVSGLDAPASRSLAWACRLGGVVVVLVTLRQWTFIAPNKKNGVQLRSKFCGS